MQLIQHDLETDKVVAAWDFKKDKHLLEFLRARTLFHYGYLSGTSNIDKEEEATFNKIMAAKTPKQLVELNCQTDITVDSVRIIGWEYEVIKEVK